MIGALYYESIDVERNRLFIEDLQQEAQKLGIDLQLLIDDERPKKDVQFVLFRGRDFTVMQQLENDGVRVFNNSEVNRIANHKFYTYEFASKLGVPAVPTKLFKSIKEIENYPAIVKTIDGHGGHEVFYVTDAIKAEALSQKYTEDKLIVQPFIKSGATDVRIFVLGDKIIGAVKRTGTDSFKSNYTLGGKIEKFILTPKQEKDALTIAKALKSDYIGIDFLLLPNGEWMLNEIEDPVGARSLYLTHDFPVAHHLMNYIDDAVKNSHLAT